MRISGVTLQHLRIPFRAGFGHSLKTRSETETILVSVTSSDGITGIGEILPRPYLTGETIDSVLNKYCPALAQAWIGRVFDDRDEVVEALESYLQCAPKALATFAGWELAMLDLAGKTFHFAAGDVLGPILTSELECGVVIDFNVPTEAVANRCMLLRLSGKRHLKVKVGRHDDMRRLDIISDVLGKDFPLRIDANAKWSKDEAVTSLRQMRRFNISSVEQPVAADDLAGMHYVRKNTGMSVMADESVCSLHDGERVIEMSAADSFNIRIGKCGGFLASRRLVELATDEGLGCQLGTLVGETGILSRAGETFGMRVQGFDFIEGKRQNKQLLVEDIVEQRAKPDDSAQHGLGVRILADGVSRWRISPTINLAIEHGAEA